ncbi:MAG TPA: hypothetical protein VFY81_02280 [Gammaproteobacteria bacterium]|nr:hypothetical protein [Gammaproteobacteria bacterium]
MLLGEAMLGLLQKKTALKLRRAGTFALGSLGILLLLPGCATRLGIIPNQVGGNGLLVAQVATQTAPEIDDGDPLINGTEYLGGLRSGTLIVSLSPGEYFLSSIRKPVPSSSSVIVLPKAVAVRGYSPGVYTGRTNYKAFHLGRHFRIERGKATNLGMLLFEPSVTGLPFVMGRPLSADNRGEIETFLQERHPRLYASLHGEKFIHDTAAMSPDLLRRVRWHLALQKIATPAWQAQYGNERYVTTILGTIAAVEKTPSGEFAIQHLLDPGTVSDLEHCSLSGARAACALSQRSYLYVDHGLVETRPAPDKVTVNSVFVFGEQGIVIADDRMRLYTTTDGGASWSQFSGALLPQPIKRGSFDPAVLHSFEFVPGQRGFYVFQRGANGKAGKLLYADYETAAYRAIWLPEKAKNIKVLQESERGVYLGPAHTEFTKGKLFFLGTGGDSWEEYTLPRSACKEMRLEDYSGRVVQVICGVADVYESKDGGKRWRPIFKQRSLFRFY